MNAACVHPGRWRLMGRLIALLGLSFWVGGCGVFFSELPPDHEIFDGPIEGLTPTQLRRFLAGDEAFGERFVEATGLGPIFVQPSCDSCHTADGKGHPSTNLMRIGVGSSNDATQFDYLLGLGGPQIQQRAVPGFKAESIDEIRKLVSERFPQQVLRVSVRSGPIVVGLGLIEAIPESQILQYADPNDKDKDGISGRANYVLPPAYHEPVGLQVPDEGGRILGRFGRKATAVNLLHQVVSAYLNDMGITTDFATEDLYNPLDGARGDAVADPEVSSSVVRDVVFYLQTLRPPARRNVDHPEVKAGEGVFRQVNCTGCHVPTMKTGDSPIAALHQKEVHLYSDLLLHDMGDALADGYPEGLATGHEWRTTPLWGLGIVGNVLGGQAFYMHDGRAKTLDQAIQLHGGEAARSRDAYNALSASDKQALVAFLKSL